MTTQPTLTPGAFAAKWRGYEPEAVAHFLDRILFCLFAENAGLLPKQILSRLSQASKGRSDVFASSCASSSRR